jgi:hypothetical protein
MREILCIFLAISFCIISGCYLVFDEGSAPQLPTGPIELFGEHYAKLNSIGCYQYNDIVTVGLAHNRSDYDTIDNLIKEKRCFVLPTNTDIFIIKRVQDDIVSAKTTIEDATLTFYTPRSNLVEK